MNREARPAGGVSLGAAWSLLYIGASRLGTFGLSVLVARALGPTLAGAFGVALQATVLAGFVGVLNVGQALAQQLGEIDDPGRQRRLIGVSLGLVVAGTAITGGLLAAFSPWIASVIYRDASLAGILVWCGPLAVGTGLVIWAEGALQGLHRFRQLAIWGAGAAVADLVVAGAAAFAGLPPLLAARTAVRVGAAAAAARFFPRATPPAPGAAAPAPRVAIARALLRFGGLSFVASAIIVAGQNLLRLLLVREAGLSAAGQFQVADTIGQALMVVPTAAGIAFLPAVARDHAAGSPLIAASIVRATRRVTGFNLPLCLAAIALGPLAVRLVFGGVYGVAADTLQWLAAAYAVAGLVSIAGPVLLGRAEMGTAILLNGLWVAVLATTLALVAAARGAEGAAQAMGVAYTAQLLPFTLLVVRRWRIDVRGAIVPFAATLFLPGLAILAFRQWPGATPLVAAGILAVAALVFARWAAPELAFARGLGRPAEPRP